MNGVGSGRSRHSLGFSDAARAAFAFLEEDYGLHLVEIRDTLVRYADDRVFLNVYHGRNSYELDVEIGRTAIPMERSHPFDMAEIMGVSDEREGQRYRRYVASGRDAVKNGLERLAGDLRRYGIRGITGDGAFYRALADVRRRWAGRYSSELRNAQIREDAATAWRSRSYARVRELYESITGDLTPVERARLAYARRHSEA